MITASGPGSAAIGYGGPKIYSCIMKVRGRFGKCLFRIRKCLFSMRRGSAENGMSEARPTKFFSGVQPFGNRGEGNSVRSETAFYRFVDTARVTLSFAANMLDYAVFRGLLEKSDVWEAISGSLREMVNIFLTTSERYIISLIFLGNSCNHGVKAGEAAFVAFVTGFVPSKSH